MWKRYTLILLILSFFFSLYIFLLAMSQKNNIYVAVMSPSGRIVNYGKINEIISKDSKLYKKIKNSKKLIIKTKSKKILK